MHSHALTLDELAAFAGGRPGVHDVACPLCGPERRAPANRVRKVLRVWLVDERFATISKFPELRDVVDEAAAARAEGLLP